MDRNREKQQKKARRARRTRGQIRGTAERPRLSVTRSSNVEDKIYEAVREAVICGWDVRRFLSEAQEAWDYEMREMRKDAAEEFRKAMK